MGELRVLIPYKPRPLQAELHRRLKRFSLVVMHRRAGKTVFAINELIRKAIQCPLPRPRVAYVAPLYRQAKSIAWDYLQHYTRPIPGATANQAELRIDLPNEGRIQLFGADNPDSLRGLYFDFVVIDEMAQIDPELWPQIIRPALADRKGGALVIGTPKGRNAFWEFYEAHKHDPEWLVETHRASETKILDPAELDAARKTMSEDAYQQEFECSWTASVKGTYFGDLINKARDEKRICRIPVETRVPVHTFWDLGRNDSTSILFMQQVGPEHRFIDCYEANGEGLDHYARVLKDKGYFYGDHYLPHDVDVTELTTNRSRRETLEALGVKPIKVVPRIGHINEGIEMARQMLPSCWFDVERCDYAIRCLENYAKDWDEKHQVFRSSPRHDWASHMSDAFRMFAQGYRGFSKWAAPKIEGRQRIKPEKSLGWMV